MMNLGCLPSAFSIDFHLFILSCTFGEMPARVALASAAFLRVLEIPNASFTTILSSINVVSAWISSKYLRKIALNSADEINFHSGVAKAGPLLLPSRRLTSTNFIVNNSFFKETLFSKIQMLFEPRPGIHLIKHFSYNSSSTCFVVIILLVYYSRCRQRC